MRGGFWNDAALGSAGAQAEAVRVPLAAGTLVKVYGGESLDDATQLSLLRAAELGPPTRNGLGPRHSRGGRRRRR
ncbi:hypothetical protein BFL43_15615 [Williamsia sp. 1135]|nr:hypothetical protein BFL43_15615 [Williamsia sp. 1135]